MPDLRDFRCRCNRLLAQVSEDMGGVVKIKCSRCHEISEIRGAVAVVLQPLSEEKLAALGPETRAYLSRS